MSSLSKCQIVGYSAGNFGKNILWNSLEFCLLFVFTDILGFDPWVAGTIILISLVWDAVLDPIVGFMADKVRSRIGKYGPFILIGAPLCAASYVALFSIPLLPIDQIVVAAAVCLVLFRTFYSLVDVPHNALLARITNSSKERTVLSGTRYLFSALASLSIAVALRPILDPTSASSEATNFFVFAIFVAPISVLALVISWWVVRRIDIDSVTTDAEIDKSFAGIRYLARNRPFIVVMAVAFLTGLTTPMFTKLFIYYSKYVVLDESLASNGLIAFTLCSALGVPFWIWLAHKWNKGRALQAAHVSLFIVCTGFFAVFPTWSTGATIGACLVGFSSGAAYLMIWTLAADVVEYSELNFGRRIEAGGFSLLILAMKGAIGLGSGMLGFALGYAGYVPNVAQTEGTILVMRIMMCLVPAAGSLLIIAALSNYQIGHKQHAENLARLADRQRSRPASDVYDRFG